MANQIIKLTSDTTCIDEGGVRFFLLEGKEKALLIDSGMNTHDAKEIAESLTSKPVELLNTHADRDHVGSNAEFEWVYLHPSEAANYYGGAGQTGDFVPVYDGTVLDLGGRVLQIIALPGHTEGSIAVLDEKQRFLISGDPIQDGSVFMFGPHRELHAYQKSLEHLLTATDKFDTIYPSHGSLTVTPDILPKLIQGAKDVLAGKIKGEPKEMFGNTIMVYDFGAAKFLMGK